ncbi:MAG: alpha/beta hydrolase [Pseudomonadota bacterium]
MSYLSEDGLQLRADVAGPDESPEIILLHGGGQTRFSWHRSLQDLVKAGYRVTAPDLRGHGQSEWSSDGCYELDHYIADLRVILGTLSKAPVVIGASLGGVISLIALGEGAISNLKALVLVDVVPRMDAAGVGEILDFMAATQQGFSNPEAARDAIARYLPHRPRASRLDGLLKNLRLKDDGRYYWHWDPRIHNEASVDRRLASMAKRMEAAAASIRIPVLVLRGAASRVVSREGAAHLAALIPHAEFVDVASADHMIAGDQNDAFIAEILSFLSAINEVGSNENYRV